MLKCPKLLKKRAQAMFIEKKDAIHIRVEPATFEEIA
jgi:hypothetical protein